MPRHKKCCEILLSALWNPPDGLNVKLAFIIEGSEIEKP